MKYFYETHISGDMGLEEFEKLCDKAWSKKHTDLWSESSSSMKYGYIVINIWEPPECGRYVLNYDTLYIPNKYIKIHRNT